MRKRTDYRKQERKIILKKEDLLVIVPVTIIFMLQLSYTIMLNNDSLKGIQLGKLQDEIATYKLSNELLREDYLQHRSLGTIRDEAYKAQFHDVTTSDYLIVK